MPDEGAAVPGGLNRILADCFVLRCAVQMTSWRLQPAAFGTEWVFEDLMTFLDKVTRKAAVRICVLGGTPASGFDELVKLASCKPPLAGGEAPGFGELAHASLEVVRDFHTMGQIAQESGDVATAYLLQGRVGQLEEAAWRLATLAKATGVPDSNAGLGAL
jgi:DNA-binding ferritin-like protein